MPAKSASRSSMLSARLTIPALVLVSSKCLTVALFWWWLRIKCPNSCAIKKFSNPLPRLALSHNVSSAISVTEPSNSITLAFRFQSSPSFAFEIFSFQFSFPSESRDHTSGIFMYSLPSNSSSRANCTSSQMSARRDVVSVGWRRFITAPSATPARGPAGVALHAGAVADQCVVAAFAAGLALVALHPRLGAGVHRCGGGGDRGAAVLHRLAAALHGHGHVAPGEARRDPLPALQHHQLLRQALAQVARGADLLEHLQRAVGRLARHFLDVADTFLLAAPEIVEARPRRFDMRQIGAVKVADRQFAEDVVEDRGGVLDAVIALHKPRGLELGEGEGIDEFLERHAVLQAHRHGDGEIVHHRAEARALLVHVDEDLAQLAVAVFAGAQIDLVAADDGLLRVALAALGQLVAGGADHLLDHHLLDDLLGQHRGLFLRAAGFQNLGSLVIVLDQRRGQRLRHLGAVAV